MYFLLIVQGIRVGYCYIVNNYILRVEKITCIKVIPVIATLYLLSYNKIMMVTFRGLFSYNIWLFVQWKHKLDKSISTYDTSFLVANMSGNA